jgi:hypothetical protein
VAEPNSSFDPVELAAATAGHLPDYNRKHWLSGATLERWMLAEQLAGPNGAAGRLELTEAGTALVALVAETWRG